MRALGVSREFNMIEWLFFNTLIPLSPVLIVKGISWLVSDTGRSKTIFSIISDGQVFFYCTATCSVAIGDFKNVPKDLVGFDPSPWLMGFIFILLLSTVAFTVAALNRSETKEGKFGWSSIAMAIAATVTAVFFRSETGLL